MKHPVAQFLLLLTGIFVFSSQAGIGQSAVITLVFPYGARSAGMGEVGTALADDGSVLFFNPAGLALPNSDFEGGVCSYSYEPLLPAFQLDSLWHNSFSANYQDTTFKWGQFGFFRNFINMGVNTWSDELGRVLGKSHSYETVYGLGWGFDLKECGMKNHYFGLTLKYYNSVLAPGFKGSGTGIGRGIATDAGYLWTIGRGFRLGATLMNMGPSVSYFDSAKSDPIPFTVNLAVAYKKEFEVEGVKFVGVAGEFRFDREIVKNHTKGNPDPFYKAVWTDFLFDPDETPKFELLQINRHYGGEITFFNTLSLRMGYLIDIVGERYESHHGFGIKLFNHLSFDRAIIYSPAGYGRTYAQRYGSWKEGSSGARDGQWQWSFTAKRLLNWSVDDLLWWQSGR
jgi:hypothetical protein